MAKLPITASVSWASNGDGTITATLTLTDGDGTVFVSAEPMRFEATARALDMLSQMRGIIKSQIADHIGYADLPTNFSVQIGLDTSLRELDLL